MRLHSQKLTWQWKTTSFNRKYMFEWLPFHCYVSYIEVFVFSIYLHKSCGTYSPSLVKAESHIRSMYGIGVRTVVLLFFDFRALRDLGSLPIHECMALPFVSVSIGIPP